MVCAWFKLIYSLSSIISAIRVFSLRGFSQSCCAFINIPQPPIHFSPIRRKESFGLQDSSLYGIGFCLKIFQLQEATVYTLQFDGLFQRIHAVSDGIPGIMCYGWLIWQNEKVIAQGQGGYAHWKLATSNGAEYLALIAGLEALVQMKACDETILIQGDAKTIIEQMQNQALTHSPRIQQFHRQARRVCRNFKDVQWNWTPRCNNHPADRLTRQALKQIRFDSPVYFSPDVHQMIPPESQKGLQSILALSTFYSHDLMV